MFVSNTAGALKSSKFLILMLPVSTLILTIMLEIEYKHIYLQFRKLATVGGGCLSREVRGERIGYVIRVTLLNNVNILA